MKVTGDLVVNDCIKLYPKTIGIFTQFKIDPCWGGALSIKEAAARDGADLDAILAALNEAAG